MIYFVRDTETGHIKIGHAGQPWRRLQQMQIGAPGELVMLAMEPGAAEREADLHTQFSPERVRGEWFRASPRLLDHVRSLPRAERPQTRLKTRAFWGGLTDADVSRATGLSKAYLCEIRSGLRKPSPAAAIAIQRATGKSAVAPVFGDLAAEAA